METAIHTQQGPNLFPFPPAAAAAFMGGNSNFGGDPMVMDGRDLEEERILARERAMNGGDDDEEDEDDYDEAEEDEEGFDKEYHYQDYIDAAESDAATREAAARAAAEEADKEDEVDQQQQQEFQQQPQQQPPQPQLAFQNAAAAWAQAQAAAERGGAAAAEEFSFGGGGGGDIAPGAALRHDFTSSRTATPAASPDDASAVASADRMHLTKEERLWAIDIKDVIEAEAELDNLSDFMYAQLALIERDNVEAALERAFTMQAFREEYKITDTFQDGRLFLKNLVDLFPGVYMSLSYNQRDGNYVMAIDLAKFDMQRIATPEGVATWLGGGYYFFHCCCPDFESIRRGWCALFETEGFDWKKNMSFNAFRKVWLELGGAYPCTFQQIKYFHTGMFINLFYSMTKRVLPESLHSKFQVGCQFDRRLDAIYMVPNVERASQRIIERFDESLKRRFDNVANFSLGSREGEDFVYQDYYEEDKA